MTNISFAIWALVFIYVTVLFVTVLYMLAKLRDEVRALLATHQPTPTGDADKGEKS